MSQHLQECERRDIDGFGVIDQIGIVLRSDRLEEDDCDMRDLWKTATYRTRLRAAELASRAAQQTSELIHLERAAVVRAR